MNKVFPTNSSTFVVNGKVCTVIYHDGYYSVAFVGKTVWATTLRLLQHIIRTWPEKLEIFKV